MGLALGPNAYLVALGCIALLCVAMLACCCCSKDEESRLPTFGGAVINQGLIYQPPPSLNLPAIIQPPDGITLNANSFQSPNWVKAPTVPKPHTFGQSEVVQQQLYATAGEMTALHETNRLEPTPSQYSYPVIRPPNQATFHG